MAGLYVLAGLSVFVVGMILGERLHPIEVTKHQVHRLGCRRHGHDWWVGRSGHVYACRNCGHYPTEEEQAEHRRLLDANDI